MRLIKAHSVYFYYKLLSVCRKAILPLYAPCVIYCILNLVKHPNRAGNAKVLIGRLQRCFNSFPDLSGSII